MRRLRRKQRQKGAVVQHCRNNRRRRVTRPLTDSDRPVGVFAAMEPAATTEQGDTAAPRKRTELGCTAPRTAEAPRRFVFHTGGPFVHIDRDAGLYAVLDVCALATQRTGAANVP
eukprot:CAMPEP_0184088118 /NCGR_PEP_ID=MMETSP0974-20121125/6061_1 /TAXON_ID=483370 /ORGANISM="non described non described, Strain CCMP2097" /LENGTH=114 /DNA_ID=CAMNT_0026390823 /DNA_START=5 /DNA_END=346 /DNA_ORIENTATION=+